LTIPTGMAILGESYQNTIIRTTTTTGNVITIGGNSVTIEGIQFQAASARASGWMIDATSVANFIVRDCLIGDANSPTQVLIGNGTSSIYIEDSTISAPINGVGLQVGNGAGTGGVDLKIRGTKFFSDAGAKAFANILLTNVSDLTLSDVTVIGAATNIAMSPATGQFVVFVKGDQVWSDSGTTGMNITPSGTGFVRDVTFANGWFGNNSNGIIVGRANTATVDGLNFENNTFLNSGSGVSADATAGGITNVRVSDGWASAHAASAFYFNNVSGVQLRHIHVGPYAGNAGNATGITLAGATDNVYISDVVATGNTTAAYTNTSSGTNINIHNSPGITATPWTVAEGGTNGSSASGTLLDNITGFASTGHLVRTAAGTYAFRSLTGPAAGISVSNGSGVSGNPTLALVNDLAALEGLGSTGIAVRTTTDTWVQRSIAGTANEITLMNGDGVSGNPTASLPTALTFTGKTVTGGTFAGPTFSGTIANLATVTTADINGGTVDGTVIGGASAAAATFTSLTTTGSRTGTVTSSAGSGVLVGDSFILTRTVTSGSSDITYAAQYKLTDSSGSSTSPLAAASLSVDALFQNAANTTTNYGIQMSGTAAANLTTYVSLATGFTVNGGSTLTNYTGLSIVAPSGTVTNKTAISVASGAGAIIQSDTTDATSTSDGSIRSAGGLSVAKNIIGGAKIRVGSYVVASLPAGSAGDMAFASNCRVFNGAGTQEGAGAGTGGLVTHNGTAWKIPGTNVTAVA
jgi:hypothetical protein